MTVDICMAFIFVLLVDILSLIGECFKKIIVFIFCGTIISGYFMRGCQIDFIGEIDFGVWIVFMITFDMLLSITLSKFKRHIKE